MTATPNHAQSKLLGTMSLHIAEKDNEIFRPCPEVTHRLRPALQTLMFDDLWAEKAYKMQKRRLEESLSSSSTTQHQCRGPVDVRNDIAFCQMSLLYGSDVIFSVIATMCSYAVLPLATN